MRNVIMYAFRLTIGKMIEMSFLDNYKRVVIKIGSSTLTHAETGSLNFSKMERLVRSICDYRNSGMDVCLVSSGAIAVGRDVIGIKERPSDISIKQACAAVGQGRLMMTYQKLFSEYNQNSGQVLMTKNTIVNPVSRRMSLPMKCLNSSGEISPRPLNRVISGFGPNSSIAFTRSSSV